ncbi:hypothetical protein O6H91_Y121600 [Diphasiastrum complanatum]|nr:hypothetical protein O6H91_Y121600 [Diphasiastrum complanatum]
MTDLGEAHFCLGIQIHKDRNRKLIYITQQRYIYNMLVRYNLVNCKLALSPMEPGLNCQRTSVPEQSKRRSRCMSILIIR